MLLIKKKLKNQFKPLMAGDYKIHPVDGSKQ